MDATLYLRIQPSKWSKMQILRLFSPEINQKPLRTLHWYCLDMTARYENHDLISLRTRSCKVLKMKKSNVAASFDWPDLCHSSWGSYPSRSLCATFCISITAYSGDNCTHIKKNNILVNCRQWLTGSGPILWIWALLYEGFKSQKKFWGHK